MKTEAHIKDPKTYLELKSKLWSVFDILRSESTASENYYVVLFLLSLVKDKIVTPELLAGEPDIKAAIDTLLKGDHGDDAHLSQYKAIYPSFRRSIKELSSKGLHSVLKVMNELESTSLAKQFSLLFDEVLYSIAKSRGSSDGEYLQPLAITKLMLGAAELPEKARVFNPFAGLASYGVELAKDHDYFGQEVNQNVWALGSLRILAYGRQGFLRYTNDNSLLSWPDESEKFDLVLASPPFNMRFTPSEKNAQPGVQSAEQFLLERGIRALNDTGQLVALLPQGFLTGEKYEYKLRKFLVDEDLIDTIITLPGGLLSSTGIPVIILLVNKRKKRPGKIRFIDGSKFVESNGMRDKVLDDKMLISIIRATHKGPNYSETKEEFWGVMEAASDYNRADEKPASIPKDDHEQIVDSTLIKESGYGLNAQSVFQKPLDGVKLKEILEIIPGSRAKLPTTGKLIRIRNLKNDSLDFRLDTSTIESSGLQTPSASIVSQTSLLLATRGKSLKPTLFKYAGEPVLIRSDIHAFKINEELADIPYLINELHADYVEEQLAAYRYGATIPTIKTDDLLKVGIKLPSLQEQRAKVEGIAELSGRVYEIQQDRNTIVRAQAANQFDEFASLKHTLGSRNGPAICRY